MLLWEIKKLAKNRWNLFLFAALMSFWGIRLYFAAQKGADRFFMTSISFWHLIGSLMIGFMILFVNTRLFSWDEEEKVKEAILATKSGKARLFLFRMLANALYTTGIAILFLFIQVLGFFIFNRYENLSITFIVECLESFPYVWAGSVLFSVFAACVCTVFQSHMVATVLCGILFGTTYLLRGNLLQPYSLEWFLEKGFFSYFIRAKDIVLDSQFMVLMIWYGIFLASVLVLTITLQIRRHEL